MAERMTCLSIATLFNGDHNSADIPRFISAFSEALYAGEGKKPQFLAALDITTDLPLRLLVGVPTKSLTRAHRLVAEGAVSMIFGRTLGDTKGLWSNGRGWAPTNPQRTAAPVAASRLDRDWMLSLGVPKAIWENDVLFSKPFSGPSSDTASSSMRCFLALAAYGFADPRQFFTSAAYRDTI